MFPLHVGSVVSLLVGVDEGDVVGSILDDGSKRGLHEGNVLGSILNDGVDEGDVLCSTLEDGSMLGSMKAMYLVLKHSKQYHSI
jgi:hypothetical protein